MSTKIWTDNVSFSEANGDWDGLYWTPDDTRLHLRKGWESRTWLGQADETEEWVGDETEEVQRAWWRADFDSGSPTSGWGYLSWQDVGTGTVKARIKSAPDQASFATEDWYPYSYGAGSWASGGDLNQARITLGACGLSTAGLSFGGWTSGSTYVADTEEYNGASWNTGGDLNVARRATSGCGTQTAGLCTGGENVGGELSSTEEYDGTSWSTGGNLMLKRRFSSTCGNQDSALAIGGVYVPISPDVYIDKTEEYDGSVWTSGGDLTGVRGRLASAGSQIAGLCFGGYNGSIQLGTSEEYDGTTWNSGGDLNVTRELLAGAGLQNAGLSIGGFVASAQNATEEYDGASWVSGGNLNVSTYWQAGAGYLTSALSIGGRTPALNFTATTEEYTKSYTPSYYESQPQDVECPDNRWCRLEMTLEKASTPILNWWQLNYGEDC